MQGRHAAAKCTEFYAVTEMALTYMAQSSKNEPCKGYCPYCSKLVTNNYREHVKTQINELASCSLLHELGPYLVLVPSLTKTKVTIAYNHAHDALWEGYTKLISYKWMVTSTL